MVIRHVADRMPERISSLIYLDAFVLENGKTLFGYLPDNGESGRKLAVAHGDRKVFRKCAGEHHDVHAIHLYVCRGSRRDIISNHPCGRPAYD
jgi:hypothetical protein